MKLRDIKAASEFKNSVMIILGTAILAFGAALFLIPFELVSGGAMGISIIVSHLLPYGFITPELILAVISWGLFILGAVTLGKAFAAKTLLSTLVYSPLVAIFSRLVSADVLGGYFSLSSGRYADIAIILACVFGGALIGVGASLTFIGGGSTGGTDILALLLAKRIRGLKSSTAMFSVDALIVLLGIFAIKDLTKSLLGIASAVVCAAVVDKLFIGGKRALSAEIVTGKYEELKNAIASETGRKVTLTDTCHDAVGKKSATLKLTFTMKEYNGILAVIEKTDPAALVTVYRVYKIDGEWR